MRSFWRLLALAAVASVPVAAVAQTAPPGFGPAPGTSVRDDTVHRHLGFFIRPDLGFGYLTSSESVGSTDVTISGFAGVAGLAIGGAVTENLILGAHIFTAAAPNPSVSAGTTSGNTSDTTVSMFGIGPEVTYYFMPANVYLSGTLALSRMTVSVRGTDRSTDWGFGTRVAAGKEWWVSDHWGLGLSGHISYSANNDPDGTGGGNTLSTWTFALAFSATYN